MVKPSQCPDNSKSLDFCNAVVALSSGERATGVGHWVQLGIILLHGSETTDAGVCLDGKLSIKEREC